MATNVKIGVLLPTRMLVMMGQDPKNADLLFSMTEKIEAAGLDSVWVGDSLTYNPRLESLTTLAALGARTRNVRLGTEVLVAALRNPAWLASMVATLDVISEGRLVLGVGLGANVAKSRREDWLGEWRAAGADTSARPGRLEEMVEALQLLGSGEVVSYPGKHINVDSVRILPRPVQDSGVPVLFVCDSVARQETQFRRAIRLGDGFIIGRGSPEDLVQMREKIDALCAEAGRDPQQMELLKTMVVNLDNDVTRGAEESDRYLMTYYGENFWGDDWGPFAQPERTAERLRQYAAAGAQTVTVRFAAFDQERQLDIFLNKVLPAVQ